MKRLASMMLALLFLVVLQGYPYSVPAAGQGTRLPVTRLVPGDLLNESVEIGGAIFSSRDGTVLIRSEEMSRSEKDHRSIQPGKSTLSDMDRSGRALRPWTSAGGPFGGYVTGLTIDPDDPSLMFVGTAAGGVYRSTDGGDSWHPSREGILCDWVKQIDLSPDSPGTVYAAANAYWRGDEGDVYRSDDGGENWSSLGLSGTWWSGVHAVRGYSDRVLAGGQLGIYLSSDGGDSWSYRSGTSSALKFTFDPTNPDIIYSGSYGYYMYRSTDAGETWAQLGASIPNGNLRSVAVDPENSDVIYCSAYSSLGGGSEGIYRSTDFGTTWTHVLTQNTWYVKADPHVSGVVWAAGDGPAFTGLPGLWKSTDMGNTWVEMNPPTDHYYAPFAMIIDIDPSNSDAVYVGFYRAGIFRTSDGGITWEPANDRLASDFVQCVAVHPSQPATVYAGTFQAALWKTTDGGSNWFWSSNGFSETNNSVNAIIVDPEDPQRLFMGGSNSGVYLSTDAGNSWDLTSLAQYSEVRTLYMSPHDRDEIWAGVSNSSATVGLWKTTDGGNFWTEKLSLAGYSVAVSPVDPNVVYAGTGTWFMEPAFIYVSVDGGETWFERYNDGYGAITSIAIDPIDPMIIYASSLYHNVIKSTNGGQTWTPDYAGFDPGGRIFRIATDPLRQNTVYAAVDDDIGFYVSFNGGLDWYPYNNGLWLRSIVPLIANPLGDYRIFYTGTMGCGLYFNFVEMP